MWLILPIASSYWCFDSNIIIASQDVTLVIRGRSESGQTIEIRQETTVSNEETQIVRIKIGDLGEGK